MATVRNHVSNPAINPSDRSYAESPKRIPDSPINARLHGLILVAEFISPEKVYTFSFIVGNTIQKSVKCIHSATKLLTLNSKPEHRLVVGNAHIQQNALHRFASLGAGPEHPKPRRARREHGVRVRQ